MYKPDEREIFQLRKDRKKWDDSVDGVLEVMVEMVDSDIENPDMICDERVFRKYFFHLKYRYTEYG